METATANGMMSKQEVKDHILKMKKGKVFWLSDVATKLPNADLLTIRDAVSELKAEGKLTTPTV